MFFRKSASSASNTRARKLNVSLSSKWVALQYLCTQIGTVKEQTFVRRAASVEMGSKRIFAAN